MLAATAREGRKAGEGVTLKNNVMPADEFATLVFLQPGESPNGRERWRFLVTPKGVESQDYIVSTEGRIVRISGGRGAKPGTILRTPPTADGYPHANLTINGEIRTMNIHPIVATTFHGPAPEDEFGKNEVHHIDEVRHHNAATNLEWVSAKDNASSAWHKRMSGR